MKYLLLICQKSSQMTLPVTNATIKALLPILFSNILDFLSELFIFIEQKHLLYPFFNGRIIFTFICNRLVKIKIRGPKKTPFFFFWRRPPRPRRGDFTNLRNRTKITFMATIDSYRSPFPHEELLERARRIRHVALDMDGTIYMGMSLFPWTKRFLSDLTEMGIGYSFLTNNPSKSIADYLHKLETLGIEATREEMYTTALATIDYIRSHYPTAKRLFLLGTPSMISEFEAAGFESTADSADDVPDVVVAAFDMTLTYPRLCRAAWWASQGIPYIATNPDRVCPTDQPVVLVDCGSICKCLEHATGRTPDIVLGKPDPNMLTGIKERFGLRADEIAMVGDRIYTDVAMARNAGALGVLVLSGETTEEVASAADPQPDVTALSLKEFGELLKEAHGK